MSDKDPSTKNPQEISSDDFFDANVPATQPTQPEDVGNLLKDQLTDSVKQSVTNSGKYMLINTLLDILPIPEHRQRDIARRIANGESINPLEIFLGRLSIGRIIGWVIGGVILIFILIQLSNNGVLDLFLRMR